MIVWDIVSMIGLTPEIIEAIGRAELAPTSENISAVVKAYAANGQTPPASLMAHLIKINEQRYPNDSYKKSLIPWLIAAGAVAFLVLRK